MGLQRLLLALTVLLVTRLFTFVSPIPSELRIGDLSERAREKSANPGASISKEPIVNVPPQTFSPQPSSHPDELNPFSEQTQSHDGVITDQNEFNPVQDWENDPQNTATTPSASSRNLASDTACQAAKSAVVTVHAGREIGSGSIVSHEGLVITNFHVVRRLRERPLFVQINGGSRLSGQVVASDRQNDLALIQLQAHGTLPIMPLASDDASATVGQSVCAVGSPFGQEGTITQGTLIRILANGDLQSDVELQPGNSGGPLINIQGEMIGVNKGVARDRKGDTRISYATSAIVAKRFIEQNRFAAPVSGSTSDEWLSDPSQAKSGGYFAPPPY